MTPAATRLTLRLRETRYPWTRSPRRRRGRRAQQFGYRQQFTRSLHQFESFAVAFSFISITTGIFTTYAFALATGGTRSIWTWLIVVVGQALVALFYGALSSRIPLSGLSYQWASRLASPHVGWWFGWTSFAFLTIVTVSVDYGLIQVAFQPLIGEAYTPTSAALETLVVLALQAALIITSTRVTTRVNNTAVATEIIGIVGLTVAAAHRRGHPGPGPLVQPGAAPGAVPAPGYYAWLGPFMLATLLGAYTIVGFESASNLAEETHEPHKVIPRAMVRAVLLSGAVGFVFLLVLAFATDKGAYASAAPVAYIVADVLGSVVQKIFLVFVCVSIFACGLVIMVTNGRLIFSMARDRRLPGHQFCARCPGPPAARPGPPSLAAVLGAVITLVLRTHTNALFTLFTASTIMPALLYAGTVLLYVFAARRRRANAGTSRSAGGRSRSSRGALIWLAYELIVLIGPASSATRSTTCSARSAWAWCSTSSSWCWNRARCAAERAGAAHREPARGRPGRRVNVLAIDQGTSATKALLVGARQRGARRRRGPGAPAQPATAAAWSRPGRAAGVGPRRGPAGAGRRPRPGARGRARQPGRDRAGLGPGAPGSR